MIDNPEFRDLSPEQEKHAALMAAAMDPTIAKAVRIDPDGPVAHAVLASGGSTEGVLRELSKMGDVPMPADLEQKVQQYEAAHEAQREAENDAARRRAAAVLEWEQFAESSRSRSEATRANAEANEQGNEKAATEKPEFKHYEKVTYEEWDAKTHQERHEAIVDVGEDAGKKYDTLDKQRDDLHRQFLLDHNDTEEVQAKAAQISFKMSMIDDEKERDAYIENLPEMYRGYARKMFDLQHGIDAALFGVVDSRKSDELNNEGNVHGSADKYNSAVDSTNKATEILKAQGLKADGSAPDVAVSESAFKSSDSGLGNLGNQTETTSDQKQKNQAVISDNLEARKQVSDAVASRELESKKSVEATDDWGSVNDEPVAVASTTTPKNSADAVATNSGSSITVDSISHEKLVREPNAGHPDHLDRIASNDPADNTMDMGARASTLRSTLDSFLAEPNQPSTPTLNRPKPAPAASSMG